MDGSLSGYLANQTKNSLKIGELCQFGYTARLAVTPDIMRQAWRLRHESYLAHDLIDPKPDGLFSDKYDRADTARTVVLYENGVPIGSVRACLHDMRSAAADEPTMPGYEIFGDIIPPIVEGLDFADHQPTVTEVSRLVCMPSHAKDSKVAWALMRLGKSMTEILGTEVTFISARPRHAPIYRRIGFHKVSEPRKYAGVKFETTLLLGIKSNYEQVQERFPAMASVNQNRAWLSALEDGREVPVFPITDAQSFSEPSPQKRLEEALN